VLLYFKFQRSLAYCEYATCVTPKLNRWPIVSFQFFPVMIDLFLFLLTRWTSKPNGFCFNLHNKAPIATSQLIQTGIYKQPNQIRRARLQICMKEKISCTNKPFKIRTKLAIFQLKIGKGAHKASALIHLRECVCTESSAACSVIIIVTVRSAACIPRSKQSVAPKEPPPTPPQA
jgi:hypothetical protein